ncbi:MAG: isopentenyl-diphosphate delta-isomerase [Crocinitomicaceae bacterium]|nr:isopentenyl-diphosphate delta-isomerase [Crocinitomicaceae bacterium]
MENIEHESLEAADLRKQNHLDLAFESQSAIIDERFYYEPMLAGHPDDEDMPVQWGTKEMRFPLWISSMTGGTSAAGPINKMLAHTANKYGLGMGLGSCRVILEDDTYFEDFNLRPILGDENPLFANVGIAQIERLIDSGQAQKLKSLVRKLDADGLIVHVNPLQEWLQPEGDRITRSPLVTLDQMFNEIDVPVIVKEVGQGFGPESMKELLKLPILALDFAANGGTNFSKLELLRNDQLKEHYTNTVALGHSAEEMVGFLNDAVESLGADRQCQNVLISGGIKDFLDGYYLMSKANMPSIYGQAAPFLKYANVSQEALNEYTELQIKGLLMAQKLLRIK